MTTTLKDIGLNKADASKIPHYYVFPFKLFFREHQQRPDDVLTWCREHCGADSYYKVVCYTHKSSKRKRYSRTNEFDEKVLFVHCIYLSDETDAARIKLKFNVTDQKVKRTERLPMKRKKRKAKTAGK